MDRRTLIAVFLSFLVLYVFQAYFVPATPPRTSTTGTKPATPEGGTATTAASTESQPAGQSSAAAPAVEEATASDPAATVGETTEREITVNTGTVEAVFSN